MSNPKPSRMMVSAILAFIFSFCMGFLSYRLPSLMIEQRAGNLSQMDVTFVLASVCVAALAFNLSLRLSYLLATTAFSDLHISTTFDVNSYFVAFWPGLNIFSAMLIYKSMVDMQLLQLSFINIGIGVMVGTIISVRYDPQAAI